MATIQERIERGRQIVEAEMLEQEERAQEEQGRIQRAWDAAMSDMLKCIPEELHEFASTRNRDINVPGRSPMTLRLDIPRLAPIIVHYKVKYMDNKGYEGFQWVVDGLENTPYCVAEYFQGWIGDPGERIVDVHWDRRRVASLDVALFMAEEEEANLPAVSDKVNRLNAENEEQRMEKSTRRHTPEARIADQLVLLLNMVRDYTEPEPY